MASRVEQFQALVAQQPRNPLFHFSLAQALTAAARGAEAIPHFEFCVASDLEWMMPRILLGKLLLQLNRPGEAKRILNEALRLAVAQQHEEPEREVRALLRDLAMASPAE
jgi:predicted Zn-dependent protease